MASSSSAVAASLSERFNVVSPAGLEWTLRIGAFLCFVGHGAFGVMTKGAWLPYFAVTHIGPDMAYRLMPMIGAFDITLGVMMLFTPRPIVAYWMAAWAIWTALLRPLAGESAWEAVERAGNYGVPAMMILILSTWRGASGLFDPIRVRTLDDAMLARLRRILALFVAMLLVGHGALGLIGKAGLVHNYASILPADVATSITPLLGAFEIVLALLLQWRQNVPLALFIAAWKLATESLFVVAGASYWEIVERGGSYAAPVALAIVVAIIRKRELENA